jgi:DNA-binding MarR family transcriptional regulator
MMMKHSELTGFRRAIEAVVADPATPDLTMRQFATLLYAAQHEGDAGPSVGVMADALRIHKPAVTRALDRLVEHNLVIAIRSPLDRRKIEVSPTKAGRAYLDAFGRALKGT